MPTLGRTQADLASNRNLAAALFGVFAALASVVQAAGGQAWLRTSLAVIAVLGAIVAVVFHWFERQADRRARREVATEAARARLELLRTTVSGECEHVPRLDELSPYDLGADPESGEARAAAGGVEHAPYVAREYDPPIHAALVAAAARNSPSLIVLEGEPLAGKSRTLYEAARAAVGSALVLAPRDATSLSALLEPNGAPELPDEEAVILWLDDLEPFVGLERGMNVDAMRRLEAWRRPVIVLATYGGKSQRSLAGTTRAGDAINSLLDRWASDTRFPLSGKLSDGEKEAARRAEYDPTAVEEMARGIGEFMIAAPRLERKLTTGRHEPGDDTCREGVAVVWAAIDWQRAGMTKPLPEQLLRELHSHYLTAAELTDGAVDRGLAWALRPLYASVSLLVRRAEGVLAYDHIVAFADRQLARPIHPASWERILDAADGEAAFRLGLAASARGDLARARTAWSLAAESDNAAVSEPATVNDAEAEAQLEYIRRALDAASADERETALTEALLRFGDRFGIVLNALLEVAAEAQQSPDPYRALADDFTDLLARWVSGDRLTSRADEDERRVDVSVAIATQSPALGRLAAQAILALPDDHPRRDIARARRLLVTYLGTEGSEQEPAMELFGELVDLDDPSDEQFVEQVARGLALAPRVDDETVHSFRTHVAGRYAVLAIAAREDGDSERQHRLADCGIRMLKDTGRDPRTLLLLAMLFTAADDDARADEALKAIDDASDAEAR